MKKTLLLSTIALAAVLGLASVGGQLDAQAYSFQNNLTVGSRGADVVQLQNFLESKGFLSMPVGVSKGYFGLLTKNSLAQYQLSAGISPAAGYFGPLTRANVTTASSVVVTPVTPVNPVNPISPPVVIRGNEASLEDFDARSGNDGDPEEGDKMAEVLGLKFTVKDGDVNVSRVDVNVDTSSATENDPWKVFKKAYLMIDGKTVGTISTDNKRNWSDQGNDVYRLRFSNISTSVMQNKTAQVTVAFDINNSIDGANNGTAQYKIGRAHV